MFYGCYSEASIDHIYAPAGAIGGALAQGSFPTDSNGFALSSGGVATIGPLITEYKFDPDGPRVEVGDYTKNKRALTFISKKSGVNVDFLWLQYQTILRGSFHDWWEWQSSGPYRQVMRFPTVQSEARHPAPWVPNGLFIGRDDLANNPIHMTAAPSPPSTEYNGIFPQTYEKGDIIWNNEPSPGGPIGQVCIYSGTQSLLLGIHTVNPVNTTDMVVKLNKVDRLAPGQYITIGGGADAYKIVKVMRANSTIEIVPGALINFSTNTAIAFSPATFSTFGEVVNIGNSTAYSIDKQLTFADRYVTVTQSGKTLTLPPSPLDGQTHSIKSTANVTTTVNTSDGVLIDGALPAMVGPLENRDFRYSNATKEWEVR